MSKLKPQKFTIESFPTQSDWIGTLLSNLNQFFNDLVLSYNNGITIEDNLSQEIKEIKFKNDANNFPLKFKTKFVQNPKGATLIYAYDDTSSTQVGVNPVINWYYNNGEIVISSITGLTASKTYIIRLLIFYS